MKGSSSLKMKENGINVATTALSPVKGQKRKWERELLNCQVAGAMDEDWRSCRLSPLCKMSRLAEEPTLSSSIIRMCQGHQELQWKWLLGWKRINRPGAAQIVILNTLNPVRLLSQLCCFFSGWGLCAAPFQFTGDFGRSTVGPWCCTAYLQQHTQGLHLPAKPTEMRVTTCREH